MWTSGNFSKNSAESAEGYQVFAAQHERAFVGVQDSSGLVSDGIQAASELPNGSSMSPISVTSPVEKVEILIRAVAFNAVGLVADCTASKAGSRTVRSGAVKWCTEQYGGSKVPSGIAPHKNFYIFIQHLSKAPPHKRADKTHPYVM